MGTESELKTPPPHDLPGDSLQSYNPLHSRGINPSESGSNLSPHMRSLLEEAINESLRLEHSPDEGTLEGKFELREIIGKGGFGEVWEALQVQLSRVVAVKRLRRDLLDTGALSPGQTMEKIQALRICSRQEALTTANLEHPNIVPVHDLGTAEDGSPLIAMKYIRGKPWDEILADDWEKLPAAEFLQTHLVTLIQMTQAVAFAHSRGVIHRDLKPSQVIVGEFGEVLLADWGLAVIMDHKQLGEVGLNTRDFLPTPADATNPAGTPAFMAPEQTEKTGHNIGPWTDIYLLGGTLYFLLTLKPPHGGNSAREAFMRANLGEVIDPATRAPGRPMPQGLVDLAMRAMEPEPGDRVPSAAEFLAELRKFQRGDSDRRESIALTEKVSVSIEKDDDSYEKFSECLMDLGKAQALWKDNQHLGYLFDKAHSRFCRMSLAQGDLALARIQANAIIDERVRLDYQQRVDKAEREVARRDRHRFWAISMVWILVFVIIASFAVYQKNLMADRQALDDQRTEALAYQRDTLDLVESMMEDLHQRLEPARQLGTLRTAAYDFLSFLNTVQPQSPEIHELVLEAKAETHMRVAMIERSLGNVDLALDSIGLYTKYAEEWREKSPSHPYALTLFADSKILKAIIIGERGDIQTAGRYFLRALDAMVGFELANPLPGINETNDHYEFIRLYELELRYAEELDDFYEREIILLNTLSSISELGRERQFRSEAHKDIWWGTTGLASFWLGELYFHRGNDDVARRAFERSIRTLERGNYTPDGGLLPMEEWNWSSHLQMAFRARIRLGESYARMGNDVLAESTWVGLLELLHEGLIATANDPGGPKGAGWLTLKAEAHRHLSMLYLQKGYYENALTEARQALGEANRTSAALSGNPMVIQGEMYARKTKAIVLLANSRRAGDAEQAREATEHLVHALQLADTLVTMDDRNLLWRNDAGHVHSHAKEASRDLGELLSDSELEGLTTLIDASSHLERP